MRHMTISTTASSIIPFIISLVAHAIPLLSVILLICLQSCPTTTRCHSPDYNPYHAPFQIPWHLSFPTVDASRDTNDMDERSRHATPGQCTTESYLPHRFTLRQLAPKQGASVRLVLIDTGVAAFTFKENLPYYRHPDLNYGFDPHDGRLNLADTGQSVEHAVEKTIDNLCSIIQRQIDRTHTRTHTRLPLGGQLDCQKGNLARSSIRFNAESWLSEYGASQSTASLSTYLETTGTSACHPNLIKIIKEFFIAHPTQTLVLGSGKKTISVIPEFLPTVSTQQLRLSTSLIHGTHAYGLLAGKGGICPCATIKMIKIFGEHATSTKSLLGRAIKKASSLGADVLVIALKIDDALNPSSRTSQDLNACLSKIPYVVAAAGNRFHNQKRKLAYPARFPSTTFSVGAFGVRNGKPFVPFFSQTEPHRGPSFLAPGVCITSTGIARDFSCPYACPYTTLSGTSSAAVLFSGFVALVLSEFGHEFSKSDIITVLKHSGCIPGNTRLWRNASLYGIIDMRTALFQLHVLRAIRKLNKKSNGKSTESLYRHVKKLRRILLNQQSYPTSQSRSASLQEAIAWCSKKVLEHARVQKGPKFRTTTQREGGRTEGGLNPQLNPRDGAVYAIATNHINQDQ